MTRKGAFAGISYFAGLLLATYKWGMFNGVFAVSLFVIAVIAIAGCKKYRSAICLCACCAVLGIGYNSLYTAFVYDKLTSFSGETVTVNGYIKDYSYQGSDICLVTVKGKINSIPGQVSFFMNYDDYDYYDEITAEFKAEKISDNINFLSEEYNRSNGVYIKGDNAEKYKLGKSTNPFFKSIMHYRDYCAGKIGVYCGDEESGFLTAMLCGDKSELSQTEKSNSYRSGIGHLLAVSGTHLVVLTELFSLLLKGVKNKRLKFLLTMLLVWGFAVFSGLSVSVLRAAVMLTVMKSAFIFGRKGDTANSLGICIILLTIGSPYAVRSASFLMTVTAAFTMGVISPLYTKRINIKGAFGKLVKSVISYEVILFVMLPVNLALFGGVSIIAPISNLIIAPLCTLSMCFGFSYMLLGTLSIFAPITIGIADRLTTVVIKLSELFAQLPHCYIYAKYGLLNVVMIICCAVWLIYAKRSKNSIKSLCLVTSMMLVWCGIYNVFKYFDNTSEICVLPKGKGCEYVFYSNGNCVIFDCELNGKNNRGAQRYMDHMGADSINAVFVSGGRYSISEVCSDFSYSPDYIFSSETERETDVIKFFEEASEYNDGVLAVRKTDSGYSVDFSDTNIRLCNDKFVIDDTEINTSKEKFPLIINLNKKEVRRVEYGFD